MLAVTRCLMGQHERCRKKTEHKTYTQDAIHGGSPRKHGRTCLQDTYRKGGHRVLCDTTPGAPVQPEARVCMLLSLGATDKGRLIEK